MKTVKLIMSYQERKKYSVVRNEKEFNYFIIK